MKAIFFYVVHLIEAKFCTFSFYCLLYAHEVNASSATVTTTNYLCETFNRHIFPTASTVLFYTSVSIFSLLCHTFSTETRKT